METSGEEERDHLDPRLDGVDEAERRGIRMIPLLPAMLYHSKIWMEFGCRPSSSASWVWRQAVQSLAHPLDSHCLEAFSRPRGRSEVRSDKGDV
ncbi:MAG: hypothetical protein B7Z37_08185 [Verrucomicrobia bacterium 12-59-8]|nr:MAG: hypothetical protein B7Z37_08185 [Verrucomicrobia bacterium 12-59-8]